MNRRARRAGRASVAAVSTISIISAFAPTPPLAAQETAPATEPGIIEPTEPEVIEPMPTEPMPTEPVEQAQWAAEIVGQSFDAESTTTQQLGQTDVELQTMGKPSLGNLTYADGPDTANSTAVLEGNDQSTRVTFVLDARPDNDSIAFNLTFAEGVTPHILPSGQLTLWEDGEISGLFNTPWAVDANGVPVRTWFELDGNDLTQHLDLSSPTIAYPVVADPTYGDLREIPVDNGGGVSDYVHGRMKPTAKEFVDAKGYYPVWGWGPGVTRVVNNRGDACSPPGYETSLTHDFWVPCEMHDYCWDLIRVRRIHPTFYPTVTRDWCDSAFYNAMEAHCYWRDPGVFNIVRNDCLKTASTFLWGVGLVDP